MLTPTDTHYLIGLLTRASDGNDVEIELGDMVFDDAAEKERDVDITRIFVGNKAINTGEITVYTKTLVWLSILY